MSVLVRDILPPRPVHCTAATPLREVVQLLIENDCPTVAVVADGESRTPVGVIASRDVIYAGVSLHGASQAMAAGDLMTVAAVAIPEELTLADCLRVLREYETAAAPVVDEWGRCRGIVTRAQVAEHLERAGSRETSEEHGEAASRPSIDRRHLRHS